MIKLFLILLLLPLVAFSQSESLSYSEVIADSGETKEQLYNRAKNWITKSYTQPENIIKLDYKEPIAVSFRSFSVLNVQKRYSSTRKAECWYTLTMNFDDNEWRYKLSNIGAKEDYFFYKDEKQEYNYRKIRKYRRACLKQMQLNIANLKSAMADTDKF